MWLQYYTLLLSLCCLELHQIYGQNINNTLTWCTISESEQNKCQAFSRAIDRERGSFDYDYFSVQCKQAFNKEECMSMLDHEKAQITTLDAGEVFIAGRYHSLVPIMQEIYESGVNYQYAVAVIKKGSLPDVQSLYDLRGKKGCFAGVGTLAGWVIPINNLMKKGGMEVIDCNNHVKSTIKFFGPSCAVNSLIDKNNPIGDNSDHLCSLCIGEIPGGKCTNKDPYSGYEGAFRCLVEAGEIAFLVHTTVDEMTSTTFDFSSVKKEQFELLCTSGIRKSVDDYSTCNWGIVPSRAIVTSSATNFDIRRRYQRFLEKTAQILHKNKNGTTNFNRFGNQTNFTNRPGYDNNQKDFENRPGYDSNRRDFENRPGYNRVGEGDYNRGGFRNPNEYGTDNRNRGRYDQRFGSGDGRGVDGGLNSWEKPAFDDTFNYYSREGENTEPANVQPIEMFELYESAPRYGLQHNLIFSDSSRDFVQLPEKDQTYTGYLGQSLEHILGVHHCPVNRMTLCVTSEPEMEKCIKMKIALKAQLLKPELICHKGHSQINCMQSIRSGTADVAVLDASDVYTAGLQFELIPFISEVYNLGTPDYYVVAVAKEEDDNTDLTYLKNKNTCHTGINMAAGWVYPLAYLISNKWIRGYGCDSVRAAAEYFSKSCVPGALSTEYNIGVPYDNMCDLCHGVSYRYCRRDASEDYFGYTGAFRCLVEGGGDVSFVKHTTVAENTDGKRKEFWARNTFTKDFELLCPDGTRRPTTDYMNCNLGKVAANAIVTRGGYYGYNQTQINAYINLFIYAQQFYGRKEPDEFSFSMYYSRPPYSDLIFQDATQQLVVIPPNKREYITYLGPDFMRARRIVDCNAGASVISYSLFATIIMIAFTFAFGR
ncbi:PREDICTED: melanotransferrin isoform X2 [Trachymyrmex cornetzi]|uniref:melanotransferrin isoform X2 n=1 Tax=Trachymyrmex cornetzi TaxID=471704 RepID=UPI00084F6D70|nr:PREDICTED: melanotransferrin isoform X2 [Trachymyrmex cornetzi]